MDGFNESNLSSDSCKASMRSSLLIERYKEYLIELHCSSGCQTKQDASKEQVKGTKVKNKTTELESWPLLPGYSPHTSPEKKHSYSFLCPCQHKHVWRARTYHTHTHTDGHCECLDGAPVSRGKQASLNGQIKEPRGEIMCTGDVPVCHVYSDATTAEIFQIHDSTQIWDLIRWEEKINGTTVTEGNTMVLSKSAFIWSKVL